MGHPCQGFVIRNATDAFKHFDGNCEVVKDYGSMCGDVFLHTWDGGKRVLLRCKACGGYILMQRCEYHGGGGTHYTDYFPVSGPEEVDELNRTLNGWQIEKQLGRWYLVKSYGNVIQWSRE